MGDHVKSLERLGDHVASSLEHARADANAASRVRARLARGDARRPAPPMRLRRGVALSALALAAAILLLVATPWNRNGGGAIGRPRALTFVVGEGLASSSGVTANGVVGGFLAAPPTAVLPVAFSDGTKLTIAAGARARIAAVSDRGARVLVESGLISADVVHREDTRWFVDAGPFEVKVTGTRFDVAWEPAEQAVVVTLREGSVVVTGCGLAGSHPVSAGQQLHASCKFGVSMISSIEAAAPSATTESVATAPSSLPNAPAVPSHRTARAVNAGPPPSPATSLASASDLLTRANSDRYAGRFGAATASLHDVRRRFPGTDAAATAAFELGRIAFDAERDFTAAGDWFDTYLRERPRGALAREALGRALESRHRAHDETRAAELAARYVSTYPDGPHSALARRLAPRTTQP